MRITGLHHVTAICRQAERTIGFYRDLLGLALVTDDANPDDPDARRLLFGDADGSPGTLVTMLEYPEAAVGHPGVGATHHFALAIDSAPELEAWRDYLREQGVPCTEIFERGGFSSIYLRDPDEHVVEIASR